MSYSLENLNILKNLEKKIEKNVKSFKLLQEAFVFDYFDNKKINILKVGYRFKFQSSTKSSFALCFHALAKLQVDLL